MFAMDEPTWYDAFAPAFQKMIELGYSTSGGIKGTLYEVNYAAPALAAVDYDRGLYYGRLARGPPSLKRTKTCGRRNDSTCDAFQHCVLQN